MDNRYMFYVVFLGQGDCVEILILKQIFKFFEMLIHSMEIVIH